MATLALSARGGAGSGTIGSTHSTYSTSTYNSGQRYDLLNSAAYGEFRYAVLYSATDASHTTSTAAAKVTRKLATTVASHSTSSATLTGLSALSFTDASHSGSSSKLYLFKNFTTQDATHCVDTCGKFRVDRYMAANTGGKGFYQESKSQNTCNMQVVPKDWTPTYGRVLKEPFLYFLQMNS